MTERVDPLGDYCRRARRSFAPYALIVSEFVFASLFSLIEQTRDCIEVPCPCRLSTAAATAG